MLYFNMSLDVSHKFLIVVIYSINININIIMTIPIMNHKQSKFNNDFIMFRNFLSSLILKLSGSIEISKIKVII